MAFFTLRLPDQLARRFDAVAAGAGGRSIALRALIERVCASGVAESDVASTSPSSGARTRVEVRFTSDEIAALDALAAARGMKRSDWIAAVARARLGAATPPSLDSRQALIDAWRQLKRIGVNLNQAVHAVNSAAMEGSRLDLAREGRRIEAFRSEVGEQLAAIGRALDGDRRYWTGEP